MQNAMNTIASFINQFSQAANKVNQKLLFVAGIILLVLVPSLIARVVLEKTLTLPSGWTLIHWTVLLLLFAVMFYWAWLISGHRGHTFFISSYAHGIKWPLLYSVALLVFSLPCFATLTVTLSKLGHLALEPVVSNSTVAISSVQDFYLWHFMDSIPGLDIPKTLRWDNPFNYSDKLSGWILLAFKLTVIVPVIGSFAVWNEIRKEQREHDKKVP